MGLFDFYWEIKQKIADFKNRGAIILDVRTKANTKAEPFRVQNIPLQQLSVRVQDVKNGTNPSLLAVPAACAVPVQRPSYDPTALKQ